MGCNCSAVLLQSISKVGEPIDLDELNPVANTAMRLAFYVTHGLPAGRGAGAVFLSELLSC